MDTTTHEQISSARLKSIKQQYTVVHKQIFGGINCKGLPTDGKKRNCHHILLTFNVTGNDWSRKENGLRQQYYVRFSHSDG